MIGLLYLSFLLLCHMSDFPSRFYNIFSIYFFDILIQIYTDELWKIKG